MNDPWRVLSIASVAAAFACAPQAKPAKTARPHDDGARSTASTHGSGSGLPVVFRAAGFPTVDATAVDDAVLDEALPRALRASTPAELDARLTDAGDRSVLVLPYGSAFPVDAWPRIKTFLAHGGNLAVLGGAPFHEPVRFERGVWVRGPRQPAFAHDLLIGPAEAVSKAAGWRTTGEPGKSVGFSATLPEGSTTWALTLRLTTTPYFSDEHGSAGPRDAVARPLAWVVDASGTPRGCPLLEIDRLRGTSAPGRWVLATTDARLDAGVIRAIVARAASSASEVRVVPKRASIAPDGRPQLVVSFAGAGAPAAVKLRVLDEAKREVAVARQKVPSGATSVVFAIEPAARLAPGLHRVVVEADDAGAGAVPLAEGGFWVKDEKLLASGPKMSVSRDWLRKDGRPFPVVGTTYMASDVHRDFLFEPNPQRWDADFADMERRGINFVRTGIWTGWSRVMDEPKGGFGARNVDEGVLSAIEAFVQTAARHGIIVCFDLFAFLPPSYGGTNPYLDPRSIEGQRALVTAIVRRFAGVSWVHWDLINEPSYAPRAKLWSTRPIGDPHEAAAWRAWIDARHGAPSVGALRSLWRDPAGDVYAVPKNQDFERVAVQSERRARKARDFRELTEEIVTKWAADHRAAIRAAAGDTLVTLGQDEGGITERTTQQLMAEALDYTAVHTWWKNDDLLWDGVVTKVTGKPSLHQETGLMRLEHTDGEPWRTPDVAARLLERKLGYAFAARGAGVVEWVWNVNPYMPIDEESTIGLFRPDGTAKPELDVMERFARFFAAAQPHLEDFEPESVVLVVPHARAFLGRADAIDATKRVVRTLAEHFGVVPAAVSDLRLDAHRLEGAALVIVAGAEVLDERAAKALLDASRTGTKVLFTGPIEGDSYGRETPSLTALGVLGANRPVTMHEKTTWSPRGWVAFEGLLQETARRADKPSLGKLTGNVWHEPLPLELARDPEPLVALLRAALAGAHVSVAPGEAGVVGRVLLAPTRALLVVVNERPEAATRRLFVDRRPIDVRVSPLGTSLVMVERPSGKVLATTAP